MSLLLNYQTPPSSLPDSGAMRQEFAESAKVGILSASTESPEAPQLHNTPALFAVLVLPYAFTTSVTVLMMPFLLRKYGVSVDQIAEVVVVASLPSIWSFLWSPLADVGLRRRSWVVLSALSPS